MKNLNLKKLKELKRSERVGVERVGEGVVKTVAGVERR